MAGQLIALITLALAQSGGGDIGTVRGYLFADLRGAPIAGGSVRTGTISATSDTDGAFELRLPPGDHVLRVEAAGLRFETAPIRVRAGLVSEVIIAAGGAEPMVEIEVPAAGAEAIPEVVIAPQNAPRTEPKARPEGAATLEELVVLVPRPDYGAVAEQLALRREAVAVMDSVGIEEIKKSPDSTASSATRRIVGASVVGGAYLNVRGLQGRYTNVRLNGVALPSTDPDLPGFQIDLFPANLLTSLNVTKAFTPDIPGDFTGGSLDILTRQFPERLETSFNLSLSGATDTFAQKMLGYDGGKLDWLGVDDGTRALPDQVPATKLVKSGSGARPQAEIDQIARSFTDTWTREQHRALPDLSLGAGIGDSIELGSDRFGFLITAGYRLASTRTIETLTSVSFPEEGRLAIRDELKREVGKVASQLGLLGSASYRIGEEHELKLVSLFTQTGDDQTALTTGYSENESAPIEQTQLRFISRRLWFNQLLGSHPGLLGPIDLDWQINAALIDRDQPNTRDLLYKEGNAGFVFTDVSGSGQRLFSQLGQVDVGGGFDLGYPVLESLKLRAGYLGRFSDRSFSARRFGTRFLGTDDDKLLAPEELFAPENYGGPIELIELTGATDGYRARQVLNCGFVMGDWFILEAVRLIAGARVEAFHQSIEARSPVETDGEVAAATARTDVDVLPAFSAIVPLGEEMNLRASYGGTVARPLVRELAPFLNQDFARRRTVTGEPDLLRTYVHNFDLRWEWFPGESEVLAASVFYKIFQDPIESVVLNQAGDISYANISGAQNFGGEIEARIDLDRIHGVFDGLSVGANFALIYSRVSLTREQQGTATSASRPLAGQSPFVANLSLSYAPEESSFSANVFYNVFGRRISDVGRSDLPDIYEEPFHSVDATVFWKFSDRWSLSLYGRNLLAQKVRVTQADFNFLEYDQGLTFGTRLGWTN